MCASRLYEKNSEDHLTRQDAQCLIGALHNGLHSIQRPRVGCTLSNLVFYNIEYHGNASGFSAGDLAMVVIIPVVIVAIILGAAYYVYRKKKNSAVKEVYDKQRSDLPRSSIIFGAVFLVVYIQATYWKAYF